MEVWEKFFLFLKISRGGMLVFGVFLVFVAVFGVFGVFGEGESSRLKCVFRGLEGVL